ncbi:RBBP9/YdeN family alpha/beta hydrolase [Helicobacter canadensis]|uniref:Esterase n=1 Tax=Helicobacter canadensis MIT 98-5491 TaxID=537970 RepID=C5ZWA1_9HELI|nr:alpha/beta hydrolase [Helicobacter canadensis]EES89419.1 putative esterase [Helicobacter canadensis MIT 98-5491]STO99457.1 Putative hydrolase ydeN [Helicobacter canadensis]
MLRVISKQFSIVLVFLIALSVNVFGKDVYIIHGYKSTSNYGWFNAVAQKLSKEGYKVNILNLPNADKPVLKEWLGAMQKEIQKIDRDTYFITHSLGGIATLHFLSETLKSQDKGFQVGGVVLVSPFDEELKKLPIFGSFTDKKPNYQILKNVIKNRVVISAKDDAIVPTDLSYKLAKSLDADFIQTQKGGHFMESEGYTDLPLVIEVFQNFPAESKK